MTTTEQVTFEQVLALAERLPYAEQARLIMHLLPPVQSTIIAALQGRTPTIPGQSSPEKLAQLLEQWSNEDSEYDDEVWPELSAALDQETEAVEIPVMTQIILLDAGPLGMVSHPRKNADVKLWFNDIQAAGNVVLIPEIADYEVRRDLLRLGAKTGLRRLDDLISSTGYLPITTDTMRQAAEFWALLRRQGIPSADKAALDADVILAAQAALLSPRGPVTVTTTNIKHLARLVLARRWHEIAP